MDVSGQQLIPAPGVILSPLETTFFGSVAERLAETDLCGKPAATLFGLPVKKHLAEIAEEQARRLSGSVSYRGRNNQLYTKYCGCPQDVLVASRQTVFFRKRLSFRVGQFRIPRPSQTIGRGNC